MKIAIVGAGYVGTSLAVLLSQQHDVYVYDISVEKVNKLNKRICPFKDEYIEEYFLEKELRLTATTDHIDAFNNASIILLCTPTDFDEKKNVFNTSQVEDSIQKIFKTNPKALVVIKSTVPIGFTEKMRKKYFGLNIVFSPEFLREGKALYDNLYPSRIIIGGTDNRSKELAKILKNCALKHDIEIKFMGNNEAEAVKLFSNSFLAMRITFFNELDTYCEIKGLNTENIIAGVCLDPRIGDYYNNPSFGYGGYCLPKDTKQLKRSYDSIPENLISAIIDGNNTRKNYIASRIINREPKVVGIYKLAMKSDSDNFRASAIIDVIKFLKKDKLEIIIYEPQIKEEYFEDCFVEKDFNNFICKSEIIVANRIDERLKDYSYKVYSRDIYNRD